MSASKQTQTLKQESIKEREDRSTSVARMSVLSKLLMQDYSMCYNCYECESFLTCCSL